MRKVILYSATSLNGKIARPDGDIKWLESIPNPGNIDYGYARFYDSIDTTIQGYKTFNQVIGWGIEFPYKDRKNYVLTRNRQRQHFEYVEFITKDHINFIRKLKEGKGKDIWLIGGGQVNTLLLNAKLIDEIQVFVMPVVIPDGIELFENKPPESQLDLVDSKTYSNGVVELNYRIIYA